MTRILFLILLAAAVLWWLGRHLRRPPARRPPTPAEPPAAPWRAMVRCTECGIHFPAADAVHDDSARAYCCTAHRERHARYPREH